MTLTMAHCSRARVSPREKTILNLVAQGFSNRAIAQELVIGERTVRNYVSRLLSKFQVHNRTQLAAAWLAMEQKRRGHRRFRGTSAFERRETRSRA